MLVFARTVYESWPEPVRAADGIDSHEGTPDVDHWQPAPVVTAIVPVLPPAAAPIVRGDTVNGHPPGWVTVMVRPATETVPVRCADPWLTATTIPTLPAPVLVALPLMPSQFVPLVADHEQPLAVDTVTVAVSPPAGEVRLEGEMAYVQGAAAAAAWLTANERPAMVSVADRDVDAVLAATLKATVAVPLPLAPDVIVIQPAGLAADHAQPLTAFTVTDPVEPAAGTEALADVSVGEHVGVYEKRLETALAAEPPGPTAATRA